MCKKYIIREDELIYYSRQEGFVSVKKENPNYKKILEFLVSPDFSETKFLDMAREEFDVKKELGSEVEKIEIPTEVNKKIGELVSEGYEKKHYEKFFHRCSKNPNPESVKMLFEFLTKHHLTIDQDGFFYAYKKVKSDLFDVYTGKIKNTVGTYVEIPREKCTFDPRSACGPGLHCGSLEYAQNYDSDGGKVLLIKVDPKDVVSVPYDHNAAKIRVCRYYVDSIYEAETALPNTVINGNKKKVAVKNCRTSQWTPEEEEILRKTVLNSQNVNWKQVAGVLKRTAESCRKKWYSLKKTVSNNLKVSPKAKSKLPKAKTSPISWTPMQETKLEVAVKKHGTKWKVIANIVGMSESACRSKWRRLKK